MAVLLIIVLGLAAVLALLVRGPDEQGCLAVSRFVTYYIGGTAAGVDLTYSNGSGGIGQQSNVRMPEPGDGLEVGCVTLGTAVVLTVQNVTDTGSVECTIDAGGKTIQHVRSNGAYAIASCSGTVS